MKRFKQIVLGSNSYLGNNLCRRLHKETTLLVSRSTADRTKEEFDFIQCDLSDDELPSIFCEVVYILARPITQSEVELELFYRGLNKAIRCLLAVNPEMIIHFMSSSLVFASDTEVELTEKSPLDSRGVYEKFKLAMENWLHTLADRFPSASVNVYRIPLLVGGELRKEDKDRQLFYQMYFAYRSGERWLFSESTPAYGTSYLSVTDFAEWLVSGTFTAGYHLFLPASGNITYRELQKVFSDRCLPLPIRTTKGCPSSFLILENNTFLVQRKFSELFNP